MKLIIQESGKLLGDNIECAYTFYRRLKGLMGKTSLPDGYGLHIQPCKAVHTFGMKMDIDVLHLDGKRVVVGIEHRLPPRSAGTAFKGTSSVVELPAGTLAAADVKPGQLVILEHESPRTTAHRRSTPTFP
ncbi:hypothetical protein FHS18_005931 [Paenibacillus phyllosphaerae]|uniref:DUF192 domain-containing protein n=1 Tax=Paenibacillus phyllosphaerae TaxID=274593 RepID=A0A7W5FQZ5_9BACL|nr:DUF192 domain-containing protein [Paenibacillus phyllosphaerae]MBB3113818.1 hypothetical protein [Paenibacillus phyllosphaerae]